MKTQSINGQWNYRIGNGKEKIITVPFCALPVGHSECTRIFDLEHASAKVFLKFDGITYYAKVWLNGNFIGEMLPYAEYMFDITDIAMQKNNILNVALEDISPKFGPTEGWENFGGIIRDVSVLYTDKNRITDVFFCSELINDYTDAKFTAETSSSENRGLFLIKLFFQNELICRYEQQQGEKKAYTLKNVKLWSPDDPNLYRLEVTLFDESGVTDIYECRVGFREFICDSHRFLLNGKHIFLKGVCKHEMYGDSGHCVTESQMRHDMEMIKESGCNFVRLVHYPHNKRVIDIADELGLMVSEEPGLWWSDTSDPEIHASSLEVLKKTIERDRNHPSIVFWLAFNECRFTEQYLIDSAALCRKIDPTRLVSGANCMSYEDTLKYFNICGFDFYTMHPYSQTMERAAQSAEILSDKPLVFTEWGGYFVYDNPNLLSAFFAEMGDMYNSERLAGAFFWEWSELNDFNRGEPACTDGVLREGLVDKYRRPNLIYGAFCKAMKAVESDGAENDFWFEGCDVSEQRRNICVGYETHEKFEKIIGRIRDEEMHSEKMRKRNIINGPVLQSVGSLLTVPVIISDDTEFTFEVDDYAKQITVYGMTSLEKGYPLSGEYGEEAVRICAEFEDGGAVTYILCNGVDITTVFRLNGSSRIDPVCENSPRIGIFGYDKNFEQYVINKAELRLENQSKLKRITAMSCNNGYSVLVYGIMIS